MELGGRSRGNGEGCCRSPGPMAGTAEVKAWWQARAGGGVEREGFYDVHRKMRNRRCARKASATHGAV